ncbi:MAG TPA: ATP-binding cassette domain-containing protein [Candidatus Cloacimonadota bacterium]|nr:ATP-binding cassette domain-containing protein [Candidatus Cloacimonadota bacterium]
MSYSIQRLSFGYPGKAKLFTDLSLDLPAAETIVLRGENGSGKSSLLRLMAGLLKAEAGSISFQGKAISITARKSGCSYFPQNPLEGVIGINPRDDFLIWQLSIPSLREQRMRQHAAELWEQPWFKLSSGQQRRLALGILPDLQADYWLLDEPFAGLDKQASEDLLQILITKKKESQTGMLIVSHDPELALLLEAKQLDLDDLK